MTCRQPRLFGLGMRKPHYRQFLERSVAVDFVEVISENFMVEGGRPLATITRVREHYPVALHGVSMSIGSFSGLDRDYLERLSELIRLVDPMIISDHLCWTGWSGFNSHDLLPLPYTDEALQVAAANTKMAQDRIGRQLIIENPSSYVTFDHSTMSEWQFLRELCAGTGCGLLLDVNNIAVSAANHGFDPIIYLEALADCDVRQMHLAGHDGSGSIRIDTHDRPVSDEVWELFRHAARLFPNAAVMIERDDHIPPLETLCLELDRARAIAGSCDTAALEAVCGP